MKFFHTFYTVYDTNGKFLDYGVNGSTFEVYPNLTELHDTIAVKESPYKIAITNINEVSMDEYYANLSDDEVKSVNAEYIESVLGNFTVLQKDEMEELGLSDDKLEAIEEAISDSIANSADFDVLILRFISSVLKQYASLREPKPPRAYYDRYNISYNDVNDIDKLSYDEMIMAYRVDIIKLSDLFDNILDTVDGENYSVDLAQQAFYKLSVMLPGMWN